MPVEGSTEGGFAPRRPCATQLRYRRTWFTSSTRLASSRLKAPSNLEEASVLNLLNQVFDSLEARRCVSTDFLRDLGRVSPTATWSRIWHSKTREEHKHGKIVHLFKSELRCALRAPA